MENVALHLTKAEALVLFEWLATRDDSQSLVVDEAEQTVLWRVEAQLEKSLTELFAPNHSELLALAKQRIVSSR